MYAVLGVGSFLYGTFSPFQTPMFILLTGGGISLFFAIREFVLRKRLEEVNDQLQDEMQARILAEDENMRLKLEKRIAVFNDARSKAAISHQNTRQV